MAASSQNPDSSSHPHGHSHSHASAATSRTRLAWALGVTSIILVVEVVGAIWSGSLALLADAGHMATDSIGLAIALFAAHLMTRPPSDKWTWGFARIETLAAGLQAGLLIVLCIFIGWEAVGRLSNPTVVESGPMLWVGVIGLVANIFAMGILFGGRKSSLNMKAAFLEVSADALGSIAVIIAALVLMLTGWPYADSVASLLIAVMIAVRAVSILKESVFVLMEKTPDGIELQEVRDCLKKNPHVLDIHDLHVSAIGTGLNTLTAHVIVTEDCVASGLTVKVLHDLQETLEDQFGVDINHVTLQIDSDQHASHEQLAH
ncbi:cation diffusion facilitator family transporter [Actinomyces minihominis]|uniref:cation diffusion facilitator family transporter n=1 Tax=Actinomyces minihominis TaxID=2002838 RepID=UPI000C082E51|nr:cation diffusion facilitator family transporter [Actinomyces minihominis]